MTYPDLVGIDFRDVGDVAAVTSAIDLHNSLLLNLVLFWVTKFILIFELGSFLFQLRHLKALFALLQEYVPRHGVGVGENRDGLEP
jgi:ACR3 family arsenite efflux pump ArsB